MAEAPNVSHSYLYEFVLCMLKMTNVEKHIISVHYLSSSLPSRPQWSRFHCLGRASRRSTCCLKDPTRLYGFLPWSPWSCPQLWSPSRSWSSSAQGMRCNVCREGDEHTEHSCERKTAFACYVCARVWAGMQEFWPLFCAELLTGCLNGRGFWFIIPIEWSSDGDDHFQQGKVHHSW